MQNEQNTYKVLNTKTNVTYDATIWADRKDSYLVHFEGKLIPFSKKTGKLYGRNIFGRNILHFNIYKLIID